MVTKRIIIPILRFLSRIV